jgi:hypothetical protein
MSGIIGDNTNAESGQIATVQGITTSGSDPELDTNPDGGVGTMFINSSTGNMWICTDATAGANTWKNSGSGTGHIT